MSPGKKPAPQSSKSEPAEPAKGANAESSPLSLSRLRAAFAQMLGTDEQGSRRGESSTGSTGQGANQSKRQSAPSPHSPASSADPCEISPRTIVEAMLFVGRADGEPFTAREMAAAMRSVSPGEIETVVAELNAAYERDSAPYEISGSPLGYRLALRDDYRRMRDKFHGRIREAKLSPAALEVLSIIAYNQPTTAETINELRSAPSGTALNWLVRRKLVSVEPPSEPQQSTRYVTSPRFLQLFGLETISALPRNEELEKV
jgi:segregation and condensation protein B